MIDLERLAAPMSGDRCRAELYSEEHHHALKSACSEDREIWQIYANNFGPDGFDQSIETYTSNQRNRTFVLFDGDQLAGMSSFLGIDESRQVLEIGGTYYRPHLRGTGLNRRIKDMMLQRAFDCGIRRVEFRVDLRNARSQAAMKKLGAVREGLLRTDRITWTGHVRDTVLFAILKDEWRVLNGAAMLHGWIILDKAVGLGSTTAVSAVKRILREAGEPRTKVGHGGTLDPLASGVLPIALGEATKLAGRMLDATKGYDFTIRFGEETDTLDAEGEVIATSDVRPTAAQVEAVRVRFSGEIEQVPPAYSAVKIAGRPAYKRARAGETVQLKPRGVTIHELKLLKATSAEATFSTTVSKGTYIRALARDIAYALGTVGHVSDLRRTRAGPFTLDQAVSLDFLAETAKARALTRTVLPLTAALDDIPALPVTPDQARLLRHGQMLFGIPATPGLQLAVCEETPIALVEASADGLRVVRGFNL